VTLLAIENDAAELLVNAVRLVKAERVLRDHVKLATEDGEGFAVNRMCMTGCVNFWARLVNC
jgi:hypothetical protein